MESCGPIFFFPLIFCPDREKNKIRSPHLGKMELKRAGENLPSLLSDSTGWALPGSCPPVGQLAPICVLRWPRRPDSPVLPLLGAPTQAQAHGSLLNRANVSSLFPEPPDGYTYMLHGAGPSTHPELLHRHFSGLNYTRPVVNLALLSAGLQVFSFLYTWPTSFVLGLAVASWLFSSFIGAYKLSL